MLKIKRSSRFWSAHTHSRYSSNDALSHVDQIVSRVAQMGQRGLALTDHGNMAGSVQLYTECARHGIKPFPGSELYFVPDTDQYKLDYKNREIKAQRFHLGVQAFSLDGYRNLVNLSTLTHKNHFHKPTVDFSMLAQLAEDGRTDGIAVTTGCFFGYAVQELISHGEESTKRFLATLESWFPGAVYVEIQNHNIDHDEEWSDDHVADAMVSIADDMGLPVVITQDSHYCDQDEKEPHEALKRLVSFGPEPDDAVFPGDGFHLADDEWIAAHHHPSRLARGLEGLDHLLERHTLSIPVLDRYSYSVPQTVSEPDRVLRSRVEESLLEKGLNKPQYRERLNSELEVIDVSQMAGYMLLVAQICDYCAEQGWIYQTRGSAAGSLVCWLLGITQVDPIKWGLRFERFLSKDRTKPPDIDLDVEHVHRDELIEYLETRYAVHQIGTWLTYGLNSKDEEKGSLLRRYFQTLAKRHEGQVSSWQSIPDGDKKMLKDLADRKLVSGTGTNAAGIIVTSTKREFELLVPMHYMKNGGLVAQYSKDDIESLGLVKLDVLGSKTLTVLGRCMELLGQKGVEWIPLNDSSVFTDVKKGNTAGVFQLEGNTTQKGCRKLKPTTVNDLIAAMALFRPATMTSGATDSYIKRKNREEDTPSRHKIITDATKSTHGVMLFQEQVIDVLRSLGMDADDLTTFLKAVKASNKDIGNAGKIIESYQEWIESRGRELGMAQADLEWMAGAIDGFAGYGFNKAHSTIYGLTAYRCAFLAARHPLEFHTALLSVAAGNPDKEPKYVQATRQRGVSIRKADVSISGASYTIDTKLKSIRKGLVSIKGVGVSAALELERCQPYESLDDLARRVEARKVTGFKDYLKSGDLQDLCGTAERLWQAGAFNSLLPVEDHP